MNEGMTKSEREDLQRLVRQREKVLKSAAKQRSTEVVADFENQMGQEYSFDDDHVWQRSSMRRSPRHKSRSRRDAAKSGFLTDSRPQSALSGTIAAMAIRLKNGATNCARWRKPRWRRKSRKRKPKSSFHALMRKRSWPWPA